MVAKRIYTQSFFMFFLIVFSVNISALSCDEESPNLGKEGEKYFDMPETSPLTRRQKNIISKLFSPLIGKKLAGKGKIIECWEVEQIPTKEITNQKISANVEKLSDGEVVITFNLYDIKQKTSDTRSISYFAYRDQYAIKSLTKNGFTIVSKMRKPAGKNKYFFVEEITKLKVSGGNLNIKMTRYIGGVFALEHDINL